MGEMDDSLDMSGLVCLICGPEGATADAVRRLKGYEADGIVKPYIREEPMILPVFGMRSFDGSNLVGGSSAGAHPHDAWIEQRRTLGLAPHKPMRKLTMHDVRYYSRDDAKAIAPHERKVAPLRPEFCRFAWGIEVDPAAVVAHDDSLRVALLITEAKTTTQIKRLVVGSGRVTKDGRHVNWRTVIENETMIKAARLGVPKAGESARWDLQKFKDAAPEQGYEFNYAPNKPRRAEQEEPPDGAIGAIARALRGR
jgi:hypothetical protein